MNDTLLLNDKFITVKLPRICLSRNKLYEAFNLGAEKRVIFISAPAGYGKTVSTQLWLAGSGRKTIWIGLDKYDNTPSVFYKLFCTGILSVQPDNREMANILTSPSFSSSPVEHTIRFLSEFKPDNEKYALVLDDMHLLTNKELIKSGLIVRKRLPHSFVTLILTRNEILEEYTQVLGEGRYSIINSKNLAFTSNEIYSFFNAHGRLISTEEAEKICTVTEGWAIGINALVMSGQTEFEQNGVQILGNYIRGHIWGKWNDNLRDFMMKTALPNEIPVKLCELITNNNDSRNILETLCLTNSFVNRLSEDVYTYHNLFQEFLRSQAEEYGIDKKAVYRIAANYYIDQGEYFAARRYARKSEDSDILIKALHHLNQVGSASLDEFVSFSKLYGNEIPSESVYDQAPFLYSILMWENYLLGNAAKMEYYADKLYSFLPEIAKKHPLEYENVIMKLSLDHRIPLSELFDKFTALPPFTHLHKEQQGSTLTHEMPFIHRSDRDYSELANEDLHKKLKITYGQFFKDDCELIMLVLESGICLEKNKTKEAMESAVRAKSLITEKTSNELCFCVYAHLTAAFYAIRSQGYKEVLKETDTFLEKRKIDYMRPNFLAFNTKIKLLNGEKSAASEWLDNYFVIDSESLELYKIYQYFVTARAYIVLGQMEKAMKYVIKLKQLGSDFLRPLDIAEASVLLSVIEWNTGKKQEAMLTLETVLNYMQAYGFIRVIAIEGLAVLPILKKISAKIKKDDYKGSLQENYLYKVVLAAYEQSRRYKGITANLKKKSVSLSKRQKEVLSLLSDGYKYSEVADEIGLTIHTVKSHAMATYIKLNVHNSMDAAIKANELGLLD